MARGRLRWSPCWLTRCSRAALCLSSNHGDSQFSNGGSRSRLVSLAVCMSPQTTAFVALQLSLECRLRAVCEVGQEVLCFCVCVNPWRSHGLAFGSPNTCAIAASACSTIASSLIPACNHARFPGFPSLVQVAGLLMRLRVRSRPPQLNDVRSPPFPLSLEPDLARGLSVCCRWTLAALSLRCAFPVRGVSAALLPLIQQPALPCFRYCTGCALMGRFVCAGR
jgi:hypothetical protein